MRKLTLFAALLAVTVTVAGAVATAQDAQMDPKAMEEMMAKLMTPGPQHALLAKTAGQWTTTMVSYMEGPEPTTSTGTYKSESALGGRYMIGHHVGQSMGMPFEGMSIDGFDNSAGRFFSIWIDNFGTGYYLAHGDLAADGKTLALAGTMTFGPMEIPSRSESVFVDDNTMTFTMWHTMDGQEMKAMEMTYTRVK
jgi:hypothetical protein